MRRRHTKAVTHTQKYYGGGINPDRGMSSRAKRQGNHRLRQALQKDTEQQMAEANFHLCDVCGTQVPKNDRMFIETDRSFDGTDNNTDGRYVDLCSRHMKELIRWLLRCKCEGLRFSDFKTGQDALNGVDRLIQQAKKND